MDAVSKQSYSDTCDLMKQVRSIQEPFCAHELYELVAVSPPTARVWIEALEQEGLLSIVGWTKLNNGSVAPIYKRAGAFA